MFKINLLYNIDKNVTKIKRLKLTNTLTNSIELINWFITFKNTKIGSIDYLVLQLFSYNMSAVNLFLDILVVVL